MKVSLCSQKTLKFSNGDVSDIICIEPLQHSSVSRRIAKRIKEGNQALCLELQNFSVMLS